MQNFSDSAFLKSHGLDDNEAKTISSVTLKTENVKKYDVDQLWTDRKKLFFKPRRSFGAKAVYRGNSISKGMFQKIYNDDYLAQEFVPPGEITLARGMGHKNFKYDLRFYVYQNKIQLVGARLFLGQVTNFQEDDGGFAPVIFV